MCFSLNFWWFGLPRIALAINEITNSTTKIKNIIFAIPTAVPAIPPKPNIAAIIATTKKASASLT
tara:strand:- start:917 stop:1111 length:195 start_codon:yes stop_codon:yes gene_type:complete